MGAQLSHDEPPAVVNVTAARSKVHIMWNRRSPGRIDRCYAGLTVLIPSPLAVASIRSS